MGLHTILKKLKRKEKEIRVLILGLDNAGKTTLLKRLNGEDTSEVSPTLGFNIKTLEHRGFRLNMWDVGGQKSLRGYWRNYFESTDAIIWVVDSADRRRLGDCHRELRTLTCEEKLLGSSLLVLANKQDLPGAVPPDQIAEMLELSAINSLHWKMLGCSAFTGMDGLLDGIEWMLDDLSRRLYYMD
ncbi:ADP-ribosylation factor-like protein 2 [Dermacentor andersoni]|uniref:ADP-ribosylation factor-like protein 2 n=1 Tax=Dermacentor andersoni TaxID=34620 RepID=UPI0021555F81|nr:ADP-ribosylation factor-like protein 2 [Dermacentor andersoni]